MATTIANREYLGINFLLKNDSVLIGGSTSASLTNTAAIEQTVTKDDDRWGQSDPVLEEWGIDFEAMFLLSSALITGKDLKITVGSNPDTIESVNSMTINLEMDAEELRNSSTSGWRGVLPSTRRATVEVDAAWRDPNTDGGDAIATLLGAKGPGNDPIAVSFEFGSSQSEVISGDFHVNEVPLEAPVEGTASTSISLESDGSLTNSLTNEDSGFGALLDDFFASPPASHTALIEVVDENQSSISGAEQFTGTAYPTSISITVPYEGYVTVSGTLTGDGALTEQTQ